ncbi:hypothetical protein PVIIG_05461 [Plasmodium vivax India VII]|uniref:Variable surface protein Vir18 n=1 Tax=Plasmodium vivax India VII TaxID=1077284 RepID=A0A0J9S395_PLAVI|nr:hypothetical protein PVIIG_05461 [Plasmodium vivax India VII]
MNWKSGRSNHFLENLKKIRKHECTNKYFAALNEIEQKIDKAVKISPNKLYSSWNNISNLINNKNGELKECYDKQYISRHLNNEDKIINFSKRCTSDGKCNNGNTQVKKPPTPKIGKRETCKRGGNCENQIPSAGAEKITLPRRPPARNPITVSSPGPDTKSQGQKDTARQESNNADVRTQQQRSITNPAPPVIPEIEVPGKSANLDSITSEENQARPQPLVVEEPKENILGSPTRDHPVETITNGESCRGNSSEVSDSDKNTLPSKLLGDQTQSDNSLYLTNVDGNLNQCRDCVEQANDPHVVDTAVASKHDLHHGKTAEKGPMDASANVLVLDEKQPIEQHGDEATTSIIHHSGVCDNNGMAYADNEYPSVRTLCNKRTSDQEDYSKTLSSKGEDIELFNGNGNILDTLKKIFDSIPNKNHIMQASAPMGIVLLLGLLFKYTPLWRVLNKKNRKKGAGIIEELNSALQESSIVDDERSIPFSYGAFEYSTFDQNSY